MTVFGRAKEGFLRRFLPLRRGVPSHDTFSRVFRLLDPARFEACFGASCSASPMPRRAWSRWTARRCAVRIDRATEASSLHLVSVLGLRRTAGLGPGGGGRRGSNEITAIPKLLEMLSLEGCVVTTDAMGCQRAIAERVIERGGAYVLALKGNQGTLHEDMALYLDDPKHAPKLARSRDVDAGHGRIETREAYVCADVGWLQERHAWPGLAAIGKVARTREAGGKIGRETAYFLLSAALPPERFGEVVRAHWGIENGLHWVLDVTMGEDQNRSRKGNAPQNLALLRRLALNVMRLEWSKGSKQRQVQAGRVGRRLPGAAPRSCRGNSSATALNSGKRHMR